MNVSLAGLVGISIYKMLVMQLTSCMTLVYLNQLPREKKNVIRLKAHGSGTRSQGHKAHGLRRRVQGASLLLLGSRL
jgi:hypothetical protein